MARSNNKHNIVFINDKPYRYYLPPPDPDFVALMEYANANSYGLPTNVAPIEVLIKDMKQIGVWSKLDVFYLLTGDGSAPFKMINMINPGSYDGTGYGGLTWSNDGVSGNGSNGYIDTGFAINNTSYNWGAGNATKGGVVKSANNGDYLTGTNSSSFFEAVRFGLEGQRLLGVTNGNYNLLNMPGLKALTRTGDVGSFFNKNSVQSIGYNNTHDSPANTIYTHRQINRYSSSRMVVSCFFLGGYLTDQLMQDFRDVFNEYLDAIGEDKFA